MIETDTITDIILRIIKSPVLRVDFFNGIKKLMPSEVEYRRGSIRHRLGRGEEIESDSHPDHDEWIIVADGEFILGLAGVIKEYRLKNELKIIYIPAGQLHSLLVLSNLLDYVVVKLQVSPVRQSLLSTLQQVLWQKREQKFGKLIVGSWWGSGWDPYRDKEIGVSCFVGELTLGCKEEGFFGWCEDKIGPSFLDNIILTPERLEFDKYYIDKKGNRIRPPIKFILHNRGGYVGEWFKHMDEFESDFRRLSEEGVVHVSREEFLKVWLEEYGRGHAVCTVIDPK